MTKLKKVERGEIVKLREAFSQQPKEIMIGDRWLCTRFKKGRKEYRIEDLPIVKKIEYVSDDLGEWVVGKDEEGNTLFSYPSGAVSIHYC